MLAAELIMCSYFLAQSLYLLQHIRLSVSIFSNTILLLLTTWLIVWPRYKYCVKKYKHIIGYVDIIVSLFLNTIIL